MLEGLVPFGLVSIRSSAPMREVVLEPRQVGGYHQTAQCRDGCQGLSDDWSHLAEPGRP